MTDQSGPLDYEITTKEVELAINRLKFKKATGFDMIPNEIMKCGKNELLAPLTLLFNIILSSAIYPQDWCVGLIIPIHKKGDKSNVENYRGITLLSSLSKLFTSILNQRLYEYLLDQKILKTEQFGFRKGYSTIDSIFTLKSLVDKHVKSKPNKKRNLLFTCFVDFSKAFDRIPREKLFVKIKQIGITGRFYSILHSMYSNDLSAVKQDYACTESFRCYTGVKQGCMLSPTLFNLFISDLTSVINNTDIVEPMRAENKSFNTLLYADDLVLISKNASDLQILLNNLENYCSDNSLTVNIDKTKLLIFNNNGKRMNNYKFQYSTTQIENVSFYKYLGLIFSAYGNFKIAKQELKKMALKALFQLKARMGLHFRTKPKITIQLFDSLIKPILLYGSEVWGVECKRNDTNDVIELVHTKFCKMLLGTSKTAVNNACRAELGRLPLYHEAVFRSIKFWNKLISKSAPELACQVYSENMKSTKPQIWNNKMKTLIEQLGYGYIWIKQDCTISNRRFLYDIKQRLKDIEMQQWLSEIFLDQRKNINQSNKLRVYRTFKTKYEYEDYLDEITNIKHRINFTKLRISNHSLEIEKGRHQRPYVKPKDRVCQTCKLETEDEAHFLLRCPTYQMLRETLFAKMKSKDNFDANTISQEMLFLKLINPARKSMREISKFASDCLDKRAQVISTLATNR